MDLLARVFVLLACAIIATEAWYYSDRRTKRNYRNQCDRKIEECSSRLQEHPFIGGESTDYRTLIRDVDQLCGLFDESKGCLEDARGICIEGYRTGITAVISIGSFLCSDHGRSLVEDFRQNSPCYDNPRFFFQIDSIVAPCWKREGHESSDWYCERKNQLIECTGERVTDRCGDAAGRLAQKITELGMDAGLEGQCNHESMKRALEMFGYDLK